MGSFLESVIAVVQSVNKDVVKDGVETRWHVWPKIVLKWLYYNWFTMKSHLSIDQRHLVKVLNASDLAEDDMVLSSVFPVFSQETRVDIFIRYEEFVEYRRSKRDASILKGKNVATPPALISLQITQL